MLRNPIERAYSNYLWTKNNLEQLSFEKAILKEHVRSPNTLIKKNTPTIFLYFKRNLLEIIKTILRFIPIRKYKYFEMETFLQNPTSTKIDIFKFLKVKDINYNFDFNNKINSANDSANHIDKENYETLRKIYLPENQKLFLMLGREYPKWNFGWDHYKKNLMKNNKKKIIVLTPVYNEEDSLHRYIEVVSDVLFQNKDYNFSILFIDDGSVDSSWELICEFSRKEPLLFQGIRLSRNFGSHTAIAAGLEQIENYDAVVILACDLQDPPETILFFKKMGTRSFNCLG